MPMHQQARDVLEWRAASQPKTAPTALGDRRKAFFNTWRENGPEVYKVENLRIPGPGGEIPVRVYIPSAGGPFPALMEFHGGGFVFGGIDSYDGNCRRLCVGAGCVVVNVDYRLAPENKFPASPEDCYAATKWVVDNASSINVDPTRVATGGDSAGGNLSAVVALMSRDMGGPALVLQILMCPVTHRNFEPLTYDIDETPPSAKEFWWKQYLNDESEATNPYAAPLNADLTGLPPALVLTAEFDSLRDEGEAYAEKLRLFGIPTTSKRYEGMFHQFHMYPSFVDGGSEALQQEIDALKAAFADQLAPGAQ
jgi:acetyl esterase